MAFPVTKMSPAEVGVTPTDTVASGIKIKLPFTVKVPLPELPPEIVPSLVTRPTEPAPFNVPALAIVIEALLKLVPLTLSVPWAIEMVPENPELSPVSWMVPVFCKETIPVPVRELP